LHGCIIRMLYLRILEVWSTFFKKSDFSWFFSSENNCIFLANSNPLLILVLNNVWLILSMVILNNFRFASLTLFLDSDYLVLILRDWIIISYNVFIAILFQFLLYLFILLYSFFCNTVSTRVNFSKILELRFIFLILLLLLLINIRIRILVRQLPLTSL
jgi:hypothetical protein